MNDLRSALAQSAHVLQSDGRPWALVGGLAVSAFVEPRFTRDIDLAVAIDRDEAAEQVVRRLQEQGYAVAMVLEQAAQGRLATVRLVPPGGSATGVVIDLMFASSGIEAEICRDAEDLEVFAGLLVPVCRPGHLLAMKLLSRDDRSRPQDAIDLHALLEGLDHVELSRAKEAIDAITDRGYDRGRDLRAALARLLDDFRYERQQRRGEGT